MSTMLREGAHAATLARGAEHSLQRQKRILLYLRMLLTTRLSVLVTRVRLTPRNAMEQ